MTEELQSLSSKIDKMEKAVEEVLPLVRESFVAKDELTIRKVKKIGMGVADKQSNKVWKEQTLQV